MQDEPDDEPALPGPVHLVLGATGGVGAALTRRLVRTGARVIAAGRDPEKLGLLSTETGVEVETFEALEPTSIAGCIERVGAVHGRIDGIAHCVGSLLLKPAHLTTDQEWHDVIEVNLTSAFTVLRSGAQAMLKSGGSIVLVSSAAARLGFANHEAIGAAKAGVIGLALAAAASYGSRGIRVNAVAPGLVETPLTRRIVDNERSREASRSMHALGRIGRADDVAAAIAWFLDPEQSWVTGQVLGVDGGLGSVRSRG